MASSAPQFLVAGDLGEYYYPGDDDQGDEGEGGY
jgi:hypothetical protein